MHHEPSTLARCGKPLLLRGWSLALIHVFSCLLLLGNRAAAAPINDNFESRTQITGLSVAVVADNTGATIQPGEPYHAYVPGGASLWWTWRAPASGLYRISTAGSMIDSLLGVYRGTTLHGLEPVASNDDDHYGEYTSRVLFYAEANQSYEIAVDGWYGDAGSIRLGISPFTGSLPPNDNFTNAIEILGTDSTVQGSNVGATFEPGEPDHSDQHGRSVWWSWRAPRTGIITLWTLGSSFDTVLAVYTGNSLANLSRLAEDDESGGGGSSYVQVYVREGTTYHIAVDGYWGEEGQVTLSLKLYDSINAPAWSAPDVNGSMVYSSDFTNKVVVMNFWTTWCGPCKSELPHMVGLYEKYKSDGLVIIGADEDETASTVASFLQSWWPPITYPVVLAPSSMSSAFGGISAYPTTFYISRQNKLTGKVVGYQSEAQFEEAILPLLYGDIRLSSRKEGTRIFLEWPVTVAPMVLESSSSPQGTWSPCMEYPIQDGAVNRVEVDLNSGCRLFRLRLNP